MQTEPTKSSKSMTGIQDVEIIASPLKVRKRIGSTVYEVQVNLCQ